MMSMLLWMLFVSGDTLPAQVVRWSDSLGLEGSTWDGHELGVYAVTQRPTSVAETYGRSDELLILKEGQVEATIGHQHKVLHPGGLVLMVGGDTCTVKETAGAPAVFYLITFGPGRSPGGLEPGPSLLLDWPDLPVQTNPKGAMRQIFSEPTKTLTKIDLHATTLNPGELSHPPHTHPQPEIILVRSGQVEEQIGDRTYRASDGDVILLTPQIPHSIRNVGATPAVYFALQWQ